MKLIAAFLATVAVTAGPAAAQTASGATYQSTFGSMTITEWDLEDFAGTYEHGEGRLIGTVSGNTVNGVWVQDSSDTPCSTRQHGSPYWGRFTFNFQPDGSEFEGQWDWCGQRAGDSAWNGVRTSGGTSRVTAGSSAPSSAGAGGRTPRPTRPVTDRAISGETRSAPSQTRVSSRPASPAAGRPGVTAPTARGGTYQSTFGSMTITEWDLEDFAGTYEHGEGRLIGTVSGNTVNGVWVQDSSDTPCSTRQHGSPYWGRFTFNFQPDGSEFEGQWDWCGQRAGDSAWNGVRTSGGASGPTADTAAAPAASGSTSTGSRAPGTVRRVGDRARNAAERAVGDQVEGAVRRTIDNILDD